MHYYYCDVLAELTATHGEAFKAELTGLVHDLTDSLECCDNWRMALPDHEGHMAGYEEVRDHGCCGSVDTELTVQGVKVLFGCNYGH